MNTEPGNPTRIIACGVFRPALERLRLASRYPGLRMTYLPPVLHTRPERLQKQLQRRIATAERRTEQVVCLYGECFPDLGEFCRLRGIAKVPGHNCYEMFLGSDLFERITDETTGTYFLERDLIENFREYCFEPLELYDEDMRKRCFEHYKKLLYVRQPSDPDLVSQASKLAEFLELSLDIRDADYSHLEKKLVELL